MLAFWFFSFLGVLASFAGSLMMALSVGKLPAEAFQINKRGKRIQIAGIRRGRFLSGAILLAVGFAFMSAGLLAAAHDLIHHFSGR